mmetsp:Transcript_93123/g.226205  ORF Transcript_93123/g.226205 Transcript_93123/m.226205 type:complete len:316 (-) Transcript_93123:340-1287(-)
MSVTSNHFSGFSPEAYDDAWFYRSDSPYQEFLAEQSSAFLRADVASTAEAPSTITLADIGAGSCNFSVCLRREISKETECKVVCVEPSESLLEPHVATEGVHRKVCMGAEEFFSSPLPQELSAPSPINRVLIKETIHHVDYRLVLPLIARHLRSNLSKNLHGEVQGRERSLSPPCHQARQGPGVLLIMTRPQDSSHFPFFPSVHAAWGAKQEHHSAYVDALKQSDFDDVDVHVREFPVRIARETWEKMVRNRFWSCFQPFSDSEIDEGLKSGVDWDKFKSAGDREDSNEEFLAFPDKLVFIVGRVHKLDEADLID